MPTIPRDLDHRTLCKRARRGRNRLDHRRSSRTGPVARRRLPCTITVVRLLGWLRPEFGILKSFPSLKCPPCYARLLWPPRSDPPHRLAPRLLIEVVRVLSPVTIPTTVTMTLGRTTRHSGQSGVDRPMIGTGRLRSRFSGPGLLLRMAMDTVTATTTGITIGRHSSPSRFCATCFSTRTTIGSTKMRLGRARLLPGVSDSSVAAQIGAHDGSMVCVPPLTRVRVGISRSGRVERPRRDRPVNCQVLPRSRRKTRRRAPGWDVVTLARQQTAVRAKEQARGKDRGEGACRRVCPLRLLSFTRRTRRKSDERKVCLRRSCRNWIGSRLYGRSCSVEWSDTRHIATMHRIVWSGVGFLLPSMLMNAKN
jgi:hypothetical protein